MDGKRQAGKPARMRGGGVLALAVVLILLAAGAVGLVHALREGLLPADLLPPDLADLILAPSAPDPQPSEPDRSGSDLLATAGPDVQTALFLPGYQQEFGFVRRPRITPEAICAVMNMTGLAGAAWEEDPVIPGEWTCFTDVVNVGGGVEEDPSTVFGLLRGRNRGAADVLRITVLAGAPSSAGDARADAARVMDAILKQAGLLPPDGFLDAIVAGSAFAADGVDYRFAVQVTEPRLDALVLARASAGLLPTDWFSGRVPRLPGEPMIERAPPIADDDMLPGEEPIPGFNAPLSGEALPPGFEMEDGAPPAGAAPAIAAPQPGADTPVAPEASDPPSDPDAPIETLAD